MFGYFLVCDYVIYMCCIKWDGVWVNGEVVRIVEN